MDSHWQVFSVGKNECLTQPMKVQLSRKLKVCSEFCAPFLKYMSNFEYFEKKDETHSWFFHQIIDPQKTWALKSLKSPASEPLWSVNMLKSRKRGWNLHGRSFLSIWKNFSLKNSAWVVSEIFRLFDKIWALEDKYPLSVKVSVYGNQLKCNFL